MNNYMYTQDTDTSNLIRARALIQSVDNSTVLLWLQTGMVYYNTCTTCVVNTWYQTDTAAAVLFKMYICSPPHDDPTIQCVLHALQY